MCPVSSGQVQSVAAIKNGSEHTQVRNAMKRLRNFGKFHVPALVPFDVRSSRAIVLDDPTV